jgi:hypothetical protein
MVLLETADTAIEVATLIAGRLPESLSPAAKALFTALVGTAVETSRGRGYSPATTHVTMHLPLEVLASVCGVHRVTVWRNLKPLKELGLIDYRAHKGTLRGETRNTGTLFQVRLNPSAGSKCRLSYGDLKHKWRDLDLDVKRKRTAYRTLKDRLATVKETSTKELDISRLLAWTLSPKPTKTPLISDCCATRQVSLEAVLDVKHAPKEDRNQMVQLAAQALATALADSSSTNYYQKLLWQLLRRFDATGEDYFYPAYLAACRAKTDFLEGFARKPGALFFSRLKDAPFWDEVMRAAGRVGAPPS